MWPWKGESRGCWCWCEHLCWGDVPRVHRAHQLPREDTATFHPHLTFVMTCTHQTIRKTMKEQIPWTFNLELIQLVNSTSYCLQEYWTCGRLPHVCKKVADPDSSVGVHLQLFQCLTTMVWCSTQHLLSQFVLLHKCAVTFATQPVRYSLVSVQWSTSGKQNVIIPPRLKRKVYPRCETVATQTTGRLAIMSSF